MPILLLPRTPLPHLLFSSTIYASCQLSFLECVVTAQAQVFSITSKLSTHTLKFNNTQLPHHFSVRRAEEVTILRPFRPHRSTSFFCADSRADQSYYVCQPVSHQTTFRRLSLTTLKLFLCGSFLFLQLCVLMFLSDSSQHHPLGAIYNNKIKART